MAGYHIIGDPDTVLGYRFAGVSGDAVSTVEEAREAFARATADGDYGILIITEAVEDMLKDETTAYRLKAKPPYLSCAAAPRLALASATNPSRLKYRPASITNCPSSSSAVMPPCS